MNRKRLPVLAVLLMGWLFNTHSHAALRIFSCEPEWAALVTELAGEQASVFTATTAHQDVHYIQARPSLIAQVRRADLVLCTGAELEIGWLPVLLRRAGNPKVQPGGDGYFEAADYVEMLEIPQQLDRSEGDVHPKGNPHIHLDPRNMLPIARAVAERLVRLDPEHADQYRARSEDFTQRWEAALAQWQQRADPLKDMPIVVHHNSWVYLNHWLGLHQVATLEPKPGVPPTSRHLAQVLERLKQTPAKAVLRSHFQDTRASNWLHDQTGIAIVELPYTVGGDEQAGDLFGLFDSTLKRLLEVQP